MGYKELEKNYERISKKSEELQEKADDLDKKAQMRRIELKLEKLHQKKELGKLSWKEKIMMELYEEQIQKAREK